MHSKTLQRMREKVRRNEYVMTAHARKEMNNDNFSIFDVERGILNGNIVERQSDQATAEWKYRIKGKTISSAEIEVICKIGPTNKLVIITVYEP